MTRVIGTASLLVFLALLLLSPMAYAKDPEERKWIELASENFRLYSALKEKESIEMLRQLETFHRVISLVANISTAESPIPTEIYVMRGSKDFHRVGAPKSAGGIFVPGMRRNLIIMRDVAGADEVPIIVHEYAHFLLGGHSSLNYPRWFNEGLAEYVSAPQERPGLFVVGAVQEGRVNTMSWYRWLTVREVIDPQDMTDWTREQRMMFYTTSWALVHYLHHGPNRETLSQDLGNYIELLNAGVGNVEAFEEAFNVSVDELDKTVREYFGERDAGVRTIPGYVLKIDDIIPDFEVVTRSMAKGEISLALGVAALRLGELQEARRLFTNAVENPETRAAAEAGIGDTYKFEDDFATALPYFERAIELAPQDPYLQLDMAEYWHDRAEKTEDDEQRREYIATARKRYGIAWRLDNTMPETYAMYGRTFLLEGDKPDKAVEMLENAEALLPSNVGIRLSLAEAYAAVGERDKAAKAARSVLAWLHGNTEAENKAREILEDSQEDVGFAWEAN